MRDLKGLKEGIGSGMQLILMNKLIKTTSETLELTTVIGLFDGAALNSLFAEVTTSTIVWWRQQ